MFSAALLLAAPRPILLTKRSRRRILAFNQPQLVVSISEKSDMIVTVDNYAALRTMIRNNYDGRLVDIFDVVV